MAARTGMRRPSLLTAASEAIAVGSRDCKVTRWSQMGVNLELIALNEGNQNNESNENHKRRRRRYKPQPGMLHQNNGKVRPSSTLSHAPARPLPSTKVGRRRPRKRRSRTP